MNQNANDNAGLRAQLEEALAGLPKLRFQILRDREVVVVDAVEWIMWAAEQEKDDRNTQIALDTVGETKVSTVFLPCMVRGPSNPRGLNRPFETMVFGGIWDHRQFRYDTLEAAMAGHAEVVKALREQAT